MSSWSLKTKFMLLSLVAIAMTFYAAYANYRMMSSMAEQARETQVAQTLLRQHMNVDMMHDAIRADVLKATLGVQSKDPAMIAEARTELEEHAGSFLEVIRKNLSLQLPPEIRTMIQKAEPALKAYADDARKYIDTAAVDVKTNGTTAMQSLPAFFDSFEKLEKVQEAISDAVESYSHELSADQINEAKDSTNKEILIAAITIIVVASIPLLSRILLFAPQSRLIDVMTSLARSERYVVIPYTDRQDEIGAMASALVVFQRNAEEKVRLEQEQEQQKKESEAARRASMLQLAEDFETRVGELVRNVASASTELQATASSMTKTSQLAVTQAGSVAAASEQTAQNANTVAAATEELSASFNEINQRMASSTETIEEAVSQTQNTSGHVKRLDEAARKIGEVVKLISDIAEQTNLLALNATIEAARAGDAGKGFAVVASEVKALASQTARATEEVEGQIRAIQSAVQQSSGAMSAVTSSIDKVKEISTAIAAAIDEQSAATVSIASNVSEASRASSEIKSNIDSVLHAAEETGSAAGQVLSAAEELSRNGELLTRQVEAFLQEVRGAK